MPCVLVGPSSGTSEAKLSDCTAALQLEEIECLVQGHFTTADVAETSGVLLAVEEILLAPQSIRMCMNTSNTYQWV